MSSRQVVQPLDPIADHDRKVAEFTGPATRAQQRFAVNHQPRSNRRADHHHTTRQARRGVLHLFEQSRLEVVEHRPLDIQRGHVGLWLPAGKQRQDIGGKHCALSVDQTRNSDADALRRKPIRRDKPLEVMQELIRRESRSSLNPLVHVLAIEQHLGAAEVDADGVFTHDVFDADSQA